MATRFDLDLNQIMTAAGAAISGARAFFYSTGTSTKLPTYSDNALSIANTNPVVADSEGRFPDIFLQAADYRVVLADAGSDDPPAANIWDKDPIHG